MPKKKRKKAASKKKKPTKKKRSAKKKLPKKKAAPKKIKKKIKRSTKVASLSEKVVGQVEHFFGNIFVCALKLKFPLGVGDVIHVKGHTTDFTQKIDSMQIEHANVAKAKKGQDVGFKVRSKVRVGDVVYLAAKEQSVAIQPKPTIDMQRPMFPRQTMSQPRSAVTKPMVQPQAPRAIPKPMPKQKKQGPYSGTKFLSF